ncbi:ribonuclease HII [Brevibacillus laterosporus]|uniref:ribonuclease HII n=1 Tax=Brevibacillus laterosporus TaxID=1465 RepID=UPI0003B23FBC|nr:ribonuclease HII [Brevibacillus laterosporus]ERM19463.1 ribonuclease HII [Brevibacillus laterosporus PE36]PCN45765.1 ribonuclease HII [Brevibacillus laterosporus]
MNIAEMSIQKIREWVEGADQLSSEERLELSTDPRKGVQAIWRRFIAQENHLKKQQALWEAMTETEKLYWAQGNQYIVGIDEVGRGPLAGPVVASAVCLPADFYLPGLNDSKKVNVTMREAYYEVIMREAIAVGIGIVSAERIDEINILEATREAMYTAINDAGITPDLCLIDAVHLPRLEAPQLSIIGGDGKSISIAAASIVAKVTRDRLMEAYAAEYPVYGFEQNAGYGTAEHLQALRTHGPSALHRKTFGGVKELITG